MPEPEEQRGNNGLPEDFEWGTPPEGFENLDTSATALNELYLSNVSGGFTPRQAIYMVAAMVTGSPGNPPGDNEN